MKICGTCFGNNIPWTVFGLIMTGLTLVLHTTPVMAASVTVTWTFATNNTDGTPLVDLGGVKVYYGTSSSNYTQVVDVPGGQPGQSCSFKIGRAHV
mgnify:CR=1 FL=1